MSSPLYPVFYSGLAGAATLAGIIIVLKNADLARKYSHVINSFAAGAILAIGFFHLLPEAIELSQHALMFTLVGFMVFYVLETFLVIHSGAEMHYNEEHHHGSFEKGITLFSGLLVHSLIDGMIIGIGFEVDYRIGLITSLGVILHEFPEGITSFSLLVNRLSRRSALIMSVAVAVATPAGALISVLFLRSMSDSTVGMLLALAAGSFIYITASDLIPDTHGENALANASYLVGGIVFTLLLTHLLH